MQEEVKNILVPVDFEPPSLRATEYAYNLAKRLQAHVCLGHIISTPGFLNEFFSSGNEIVRITDRTKEELHKLAQKINQPGDGIDVHTRVERGKPYRRILSIASELNARFIILGENHQGPEAEQELGSTVYHVTLKAPVPVLTFKGEYMEFGKKVIVPLDLTKQTRKQVFSALAYGLNYKSEIYLVSALIGGVKMEHSRIAAKLQRARRTLAENGVKCHVKLFERSETPPYKRVLQYTNQVGGDLILVMTHQEGFTYDNYIGAFAHHIINESQVPVLSLTASASNIRYSNAFKTILDPLNFFGTANQ